MLSLNENRPSLNQDDLTKTRHNKKLFFLVIILVLVLVCIGLIVFLKISRSNQTNHDTSFKESMDFTNLAKERIDENYCQKINLSQIPSVQIECYAQVALLKNDISICAKLKTTELKSLCENSFTLRHDEQVKTKEVAIINDIKLGIKKYPQAGGGIYLPDIEYPGDESGPILPEVVRPNGSGDEWEIYRNSSVGYEIDTPQSWTILRRHFYNCGQDCKPVEDLLIQNQSYVSSPGMGPEDGSVFGLKILEYPATLTLQNWISNLDLAEIQKQERINKIQKMNIGGVERDVLVFDTDWQKGITFTYEDKVYDVSYFSGSSSQFQKDSPVFDKMIASLVVTTPALAQCSDGTSYSSCSREYTANKIKYYCKECDPKSRSCPAGELIMNCSVCGCPTGYGCQTGGVCRKNNPLVSIIVNTSILSEIQSSLNTYEADLKQAGYNSEILPINDTETSVDLRNYLRSKLKDNLVGAVFVGDVPPVKFFADGPYGPSLTDWFYMDLDGEWLDSNGDGIYDQHNSGSGDTLAEIWIGRVDPNGFGSEIDLLKNYFRKDHDYRIGSLTLPKKAILYNALYDYTSTGLGLIYGNDVEISPFSVSGSDNYKNVLNSGHQWVEINIHSSQNFHAFCRNDDVLNSQEIYSADPKSFFYLLNSCLAGQYTSPEYLGGAYLFAPTYGLAVIGQTTAGGGVLSQFFYQQLDKNKSLGEDYKEYFNYLLLNSGESELNKLVFLGDPTLKP